MPRHKCRVVYITKYYPNFVAQKIQFSFHNILVRVYFHAFSTHFNNTHLIFTLWQGKSFDGCRPMTTILDLRT